MADDSAAAHDAALDAEGSLRASDLRVHENDTMLSSLLQHCPLPPPTMIRTVARVLGWNSSPRSKPARLPSELRAPRRLRISRNRFLPVALLVTLLLLASSTRFRQPAATTTKKPGSVLGRLPLAHLFGSTRANLGVNITFAAYLDQHFPQHTRLPTRRQPTRLWLTVSDETWVDSGTAALQVFVDNLNEERRAKFGGSSAKTALVVLCVDAECIEKCVERGMYCYGGFMYSRPKKVGRVEPGLELR